MKDKDLLLPKTIFIVINTSKLKHLAIKNENNHHLKFNRAIIKAGSVIERTIDTKVLQAYDHTSQLLYSFIETS